MVLDKVLGGVSVGGQTEKWAVYLKLLGNRCLKAAAFVGMQQENSYGCAGNLMIVCEEVYEMALMSE